MKKLHLLLAPLVLYSVSAAASLCDNSTLELLNLSNHEIDIASIQPQKNTNITPTQGILPPRGSLMLTVQSGSGSRGNATGEIILARKESIDGGIHINYQFIQKRNILAFGDPSSCYASLTVSGLPESAYHIFTGESARKGQTKASFILIE